MNMLAYENKDDIIFIGEIESCLAITSTNGGLYKLLFNSIDIYNFMRAFDDQLVNFIFIDLDYNNAIFFTQSSISNISKNKSSYQVYINPRNIDSYTKDASIVSKALSWVRNKKINSIINVKEEIK